MERVPVVVTLGADAAQRCHAVINRREGRAHYDGNEVEEALRIPVAGVVREERAAARAAIERQEPLLAAGAVDSIFACGPHGMLTALAGLGARFDVPCQLSWEAYMRCAIGVCGACEHDGKVLCLDGPVLATA